MMRRPLTLCAVLALAACQSTAQTVPQPEQSYRLTASGRVDTADESRQLVAAVDGVIAQVLVRRGDRVAQNEPVLTVACAPRQAAVAARSATALQAQAVAATVTSGARREDRAVAQAMLVRAQSNAHDAGDALTRASGLIDQGFVTGREIAQRRDSALAAQADVAVAQARLTQLVNGPRGSEIDAANAAARASAEEAQVARASADQCVLRSPIAGSVLQVLRREGEFSGASQGTPLIVVGDLSRPIVRAEITEQDAARIAKGAAVEVWIEGQPVHWHGRVTEMAQLMGRRTARSLDPTDRFDRDIREVLIGFDSAGPPPLVGLRVMVGIRG